MSYLPKNYACKAKKCESRISDIFCTIFPRKERRFWYYEKISLEQRVIKIFIGMYIKCVLLGVFSPIYYAALQYERKKEKKKTSS